ANVAIDRTPYTRLEMIEELARYAQTDLICHLEGNDAALRARQEALWTPWRNWAGKTLDIVLVPVEGIVACPQPDASLQAVRDQAGQLDAFSLTALNWATALFGSVILGFAVQSGQLAATDAHTLSHLDQDFQAERWGEDDEARAAKQSRAMDAEAVGRWFEALLA
ncbi:MAG: ATP12 family protein, partial [Pseudomonadota bacterium]